MLLPLHLGWWSFQSFNPPQIEPTYPDVIENLGARLVGWDAGISLTAGIDREALRKTPLFGRDADILKTCEELRRAHTYDESARASLREPGSRFTLVKNAAGKARFRRAQSQSQTVTPAEPWTLAWHVTNSFRRTTSEAPRGSVDVRRAAHGHQRPASGRSHPGGRRALEGHQRERA